MPRTIFINIDEDATRAGRKLSREAAHDVVLVFPKGSIIFSDELGMQRLFVHAQELGKSVTIVTADPKGQRAAAAAGFAIGDVSMLRSPGAPMDNVRRSVKPVAKAPAVRVAAPAPKPVPIPAPVFVPPVYVAPPVRLVQQVHSEPEPLPEPLPEQEVSSQQYQPKSRNLTKYFIAAAVLAGVLLAILAVFILPQAAITVYVQTQPLTRDLAVTVSKTATQPGVQNLTLPGQILDSDESQTVTFNATGQVNVGDRAAGTVQIYNFTHRTLKLDAATTTFTVGTEVYHLVANASGIPETRMIPGTTNVDPASLAPPVDITADQPGDGYNLPALTRFEIHNAVLGTVPQQLYAMSPVPTQGGVTRFKTVVSQQDLDAAGKQLQHAILAAAEQQLLSSKSLTLIDSGASTQVKSITFDHAANDATATFSGTITGHVTGLAFSEDDLKNLVEQRINSTLDASTYLVTQQQEDIGEQFSTVDLVGGTGSLAVHFVSMLATKLDTAAITQQVLGKTTAQVKEILLANPNIDAADITLKPFWVKSVPRWASKVQVQTKLDLPNAG
jgi:hypothetical protein